MSIDFRSEVPSDRARLELELKEMTSMQRLTPAQEARFETCIERFKALNDAERLRKANIGNPFAGDTRTADRNQLRDRAMKVVETDGRRLAPHQLDHLDMLLRSRSGDVDGTIIAKRILTTESDPYRSAFAKYVSEASPMYTAEEVHAVNEFRAASEGSNAAGGFGIPVLIDPTIILTSGAVDAPLLQYGTVKTITTSAWKGVTSAGVSWSYDAEAATVSDDTPTFAQPVINVYTARGYVPFSIEVGMDYPGFADEMAMVLSQGFVDLVASQSMVGSGSSSPRGLFTAAAAVTTNPAHVTLTTLGVIGAVDVRNAWAALPERFRGRANWVMSTTTEAKIRALGNNLAIADFTVDLTKDGIPVLTGREVVVSDYAPAFSSTTGAANYAVVGDLSQFYVIQRAGMSVELVPNVFDTTYGRPTGQRGWLATARHGFDLANPAGVRLLSNT